MTHVLYQSDSTATRRRVPFSLRDSVDGISPEDIAVLGVKVNYAKNGSTGVSTNDIVKVDGPNGEYYIEFTAAEIDTLGSLSFWLKPAGCALARGECQISPDDIFLSSAKRTNTAQGGTSNSIQLDVGADANNDYYARDLIFLVSGTGAGQSRFISTYVGATKTANVQPDFITAPDNSTKFVIIPSGQVAADVQRISDDAGAADNLEKMLDGTGGVTISATLGAGAIPASAIQNNAITATKLAADTISLANVSAALITSIADNVLKRDWNGLVGEPHFSILNAMRLIRNRKVINSGSDTVTVFKEDGTTPAFTITYAGTDPVISSITV